MALKPRTNLDPVAEGRKGEFAIDGEAPKVGSLHRLDVSFVEVEVRPLRFVVVPGSGVHVRVVDTWELKRGGHQVRFQLERIDDLPHHLGKSTGYTTDPAQALAVRGPEFAPELEPVHPIHRREMAVESRRRDNVLKAEEHDRREARRLTARIRDLKARARREDVDTTPEIRKVELALDELERKLGRQAA